jgi:anti-sigma-K factor RskA
MNGTNEIGAKAMEELYAYHDGELRGLARWRFERRLHRSPELRRELDGLARLGSLVREAEEEATGPELWDRIAQRLPAVDARREEAGERSAPAWSWLRPAGALAAAAVVAVAVYMGSYQAVPQSGGAVRWLDSGGRPVMVLEADAESQMTIIWMLDDAVEGAAQGVGREVV